MASSVADRRGEASGLVETIWRQRVRVHTTGDFLQYHRYCARRLRRLRRRAAATHGAGEIAVLLQIIEAERAWAGARHARNLSRSQPSQKHKARSRMHRAAQWSRCASDSSLVDENASSRCCLEAEALALAFEGLLYVERGDDHACASSQLLRAVLLLRRLASCTLSEQAEDACVDAADELEPQRRLAETQRAEQAGEQISMSELSSSEQLDLSQNLMHMLEREEEHARAQREHEEEMQKRSGKWFRNAVQWAGGIVQVPDRSALSHVHEALQRQKQLEDLPARDCEQRAKLAEKAASSASSAEMRLRNVLQSDQSGDQRDDKAQADLMAAHMATYGFARQLELEAAQASVELLQKRLQSTLSAGGSQASAAAVAVGNGYETFKGAVDALDEAALDASEGGPWVSSFDSNAIEQLRQQCSRDASTANASRLASFAEAYFHAGKTRQSYAIAVEASRHANDNTTPSALAGKISRLVVDSKADVALRDSKTFNLDALQLGEDDTAATMEERMGEFKAFAGKRASGVRIARMPPKVDAQVGPPILLDGAINEVSFPDVRHRFAASSDGRNDSNIIDSNKQHSRLGSLRNFIGI